MFIFFELEFVKGLRMVQQLSLVVNDGHTILIPSLQLECYGYETRNFIQRCSDESLVKIIEIEGFSDFLIENRNKERQAKAVLYLLFCCIKESAILVIDDKEKNLISYAESIGVSTMSIHEFTNEVIKNEPYKKFLIDVKDELIKIKS